MNEPRVVVRVSQKPMKPQKNPTYSYSYDHRTGLYSMNVGTLVGFLMDVEGRAKLEKRVKELEALLETFGVKG